MELIFGMVIPYSIYLYTDNVSSVCVFGPRGEVLWIYKFLWVNSRKEKIIDFCVQSYACGCHFVGVCK